MPYYGDSREFECDARGCRAIAGVSEAHKNGWLIADGGKKVACPVPEHQEEVKSQAYKLDGHYKSHYVDKKRFQ